MSPSLFSSGTCLSQGSESTCTAPDRATWDWNPYHCDTDAAQPETLEGKGLQYPQFRLHTQNYPLRRWLEFHSKKMEVVGKAMRGWVRVGWSLGRRGEGTSKNKLDLWHSFHKRKLKSLLFAKKLRVLQYWQEMKILCANKCSCSCGTCLAGFSFGDSEV